MTPTTEKILKNVQLEILKRNIYALKNPSVPFLPNSPPNSQMNHLPNTKSKHLFILHLQGTKRSLISKGSTQLTTIKERVKCQSKDTQ